MDVGGLCRLLLGIALVVGVAGVVLILLGRGVPRIPGTLTFGRGNVRVLVPIGLSILLSVVLTIVLNLFLRR